MDPRDTTIGERVMLMRRRRGLGQRDLAALAEMSPTTLNRLEKGLQSVYAERLATIARILEVSADYLLGLPKREEEPAAPAPQPTKRLRRPAAVG
jgi:transcriptional regulator with XRE-family HTH domain